MKNKAPILAHQNHLLGIDLEAAKNVHEVPLQVNPELVNVQPVATDVGREVQRIVSASTQPIPHPLIEE